MTLEAAGEVDRPRRVLRKYRRGDRSGVVACFRELQDFERSLASDRVPAETIVKLYVDHILATCEARRGAVYVALLSGSVVGFVCVWVEPPLSGMISSTTEMGFVSDLVVLPAYRRQGIGTALLRRAEAHVRSKGLRSLVVGVLARNDEARSVYRNAGFEEYDLRLLKQLDA